MSRVYFTDRDLGIRFGDILVSAGLTVERHRDHFAHDCPDETWLSEVGRRGWIAITHNSRIRYTPNELASVMENGVALLVVVGSVPYPELARSFANTRSQIETFLDNHTPPLIAKVYRPRPDEAARRVDAPGRIEIWHPKL